jgi:hypothetical protein
MFFEFESVQRMVSTSAGALPPNILTAMTEIQNQGPEYESDLEFIESLHFPGIKARQLGIKDAQFKTFDWILEPEEYLKHPKQSTEEPQNPQARGGQCSTKQKHIGAFANWLEKEDGIFWIQSKPGCGKSTLMKFICSNSRTERRLHVWASPKRLAIARYFF